MSEIVEVTGIGSEFQGVARLSSGICAFIPGTIPGEKIEIEIKRTRDRFCEARALRIQEPSQDRMLPECPYAEQCGGCTAQHIRYSRQLELKRQKVEDALHRIGKIDSVEVRPVVPSPATFGYRNKAEFVILNGKTGYITPDEKRFLAIDRCMLVDESINQALEEVRNRLQNSRLAPEGVVIRCNEKSEVMITFTTRVKIDTSALLTRMQTIPSLKSLNICYLKQRNTHALDGTVKNLYGDSMLESRMCGHSFFLSPQSFFQVNTPAAELLYGIAVEGLQLQKTETAVDAYCGAGTIALTMAEKAKKVIGVEIVEPAIENAKLNMKRNAIENAEFYVGDAAVWLPERMRKGFVPDAVVVDPPRKGLDDKLVDALLRVTPQKIAYVSCDPATLARDLKKLAEKYQIQWVQPVDLFPQTGHVETAVLLTKNTQG